MTFDTRTAGGPRSICPRPADYTSVGDSVLTPVQEGLLLRGREDWVMFHELVDLLRTEDESLRGAALTRRLTEELAPLLEQGFMRVGDVVAQGFVPWELEASQAIVLILRRWADLPREPNLGDVCWFDLTERGNWKLIVRQN